MKYSPRTANGLRFGTAGANIPKLPVLRRSFLRGDQADVKRDNQMTIGRPAPSGRGNLPIIMVSILAVAFGLLTIKAGGEVLFGSAAERAAAGNYVPFVLWFNFLAGFVYVAAGFGIWRRQRWAAWLCAAIAGATLAVFALFGLHVLAGGDYEQRTVAAMTVRSVVWLLFTAVVFRGVVDRPA